VHLIKTQGSEREAEIKIGGQRLQVVDFASYEDAPISSGMLTNIQLRYLTTRPFTWDEMFNGNPKHEKKLEHQGEFNYLGYGQISKISPTIVDFGACSLEVSEIKTNDKHCVGEWVLVRLNRLAIWRAEKF
jgi:hypothetical protein